MAKNLLSNRDQFIFNVLSIGRSLGNLDRLFLHSYEDVHLVATKVEFPFQKFCPIKDGVLSSNVPTEFFERFHLVNLIY